MRELTSEEMKLISGGMGPGKRVNYGGRPDYSTPLQQP